ncbi:MAG: transposase [Candidatus Scalinduaceae bacterium]
MKQVKNQEGETLIATIRDELSKTPEGRYYHRLHVVLQYIQGNSSNEIARFYGHSPRTIQYWICKFLSCGCENLWEGKRSGRPGHLSMSMRRKLQHEIRRSLREFGYEQDSWNGPLLSEHLKERYAVTLSIRQCQRLLRQLGLCLRRPRLLDTAGLRVQESFFYKPLLRKRSPPLK